MHNRYDTLAYNNKTRTLLIASGHNIFLGISFKNYKRKTQKKGKLAQLSILN